MISEKLKSLSGLLIALHNEIKYISCGGKNKIGGVIMEITESLNFLTTAINRIAEHLDRKAIRADSRQATIVSNFPTKSREWIVAMINRMDGKAPRNVLLRRSKMTRTNFDALIQSLTEDGILRGWVEKTAGRPAKMYAVNPQACWVKETSPASPALQS